MLKYKYVLAAIIVSLYLSVDATVERSYTKKYEERFTLSEGGKVDIENMHGTIDIDTWASTEVEIIVTIEVDASSESRAESAFDRIDISFNQSDNYVHAETEIDSKKSFWWFVQSWWGDDDVRIDYQVRMPESARLELTNKYGDINIEEIFGQTDIELKYGNLTIGHAAGPLELDLSYGHGVVDKANETDAHIAYYKLRIDDGNTLDIESKYSQITIESINQIISQSAYDGYHLGDVGMMKNEGKYDKIEAKRMEVFDITAKYTNIDIDELTHALDATLSYGGLEVDEMLSSVTHIDLTSRYTDIDIDVDQLEAFLVEFSGRHAKIDLPEGVHLTTDIRENHRTDLKGYYGNQHASTAIYMVAEYGGIKLR